MTGGRASGSDPISPRNRAAAHSEKRVSDSSAGVALAAAIESIADLIADRVASRVASILALEIVRLSASAEAVQLLDATTAASRLGISRKTLYRRVKDGRITCIVEDGGGKRFRPSDLASYVEARVRSPERAAILARSAR